MYSRITAAFFAPQELVNYKRDRFWRPLLIVLLTLLFICLPGIIRTADKSISLSERKKYNIKLAFNTNKPIGLKLVDGEIKISNRSFTILKILIRRLLLASQRKRIRFPSLRVLKLSTLAVKQSSI